METKFKKGDKVYVIFVPSDVPTTYRGEVGTVYQVDRGDTLQNHVVFEDGYKYLFSDKDLVLLTEIEKHHDAHYQGEIQPIEIMQAQMSTEAFMGFLRGNIIKYSCRAGKKDDITFETDKIQRYSEWLNKVAHGEKIDPRV